MKIIQIPKNSSHINYLNEIAKLKRNDLQTYEYIKNNLYNGNNMKVDDKSLK